MSLAELQMDAESEHVVLLHGLCRTAKSMMVLERALASAGYCVHNVDYPSRTARIERLGDEAIGRALIECQSNGAKTIHFVTHSLGGILVRSYLSRHAVAELGHVVMLGPPNRGSEVADRLGSWKVYSLFNGPAGLELGTRPSSTSNQLGPAHFSLGIIAGNRSINWINSLIIPGVDDGKVSVENTKLEGMADHIVLKTTHPMMMRNRQVISQTITFLRAGRFLHDRGKRAEPRRASKGWCK